ncbi:hypothetical protein H0H93_015099, partial [Arthromyces matolae]
PPPAGSFPPTPSRMDVFLDQWFHGCHLCGVPKHEKSSCPTVTCCPPLSMVQQIIIMGSADQLLEDELSRFLDVFNSRDSVDGAFRLVKPFHPFLQDYLVRVKRERERRRAQTLTLLGQQKTPTQTLPCKEAPCENALGVEDSPSDKEGW